MGGRQVGGADGARGEKGVFRSWGGEKRGVRLGGAGITIVDVCV